MSTSKGKPDTELVDFSTRFQTIEEIMEVTTKPIIVDGDTGGSVEHFKYRVKTLERLGVSAVVIEDKIGNKRNSMFGTEVSQAQDTMKNFGEKIMAGTDARITDNFLIIARIESLILGKGIDDALERAKHYIKCGADAILIHSKSSDGEEVLDFAIKYRNIRIVSRVDRSYPQWHWAEVDIPLVVVPTTYYQVSISDLEEVGVNAVIYANQLLRAAYPAMVDVANSILVNDCCSECEDWMLDTKTLISFIPEDY